jgi:transposase
VKTVEQQLLSTEHRLRKSWVNNRTSIINQVHGFLMEFGIIFPEGYAGLDQVPALMESYDLPVRLCSAVDRMLAGIRRLTIDIKAIDREIKAQLAEDDDGRRLLSIPGIGPSPLARRWPTSETLRHTKAHAILLHRLGLCRNNIRREEKRSC